MHSSNGKVNRKKFSIAGFVIGLLVLTTVLTACEQKVEYINVGPNWDAVNKLKGGDDFNVGIKTKQNYEVNDDIELNIASAEAGKLWVLYVDPDDQLSLLYPNDFVKDNSIEAGKTVKLPTSGWNITASEPAGVSLLVAIVTTGDVDLMQVLRQQDKTLSDQTKSLGATMPKAISLAAAAPKWSLAKQVIKVK